MNSLLAALRKNRLLAAAFLVALSLAVIFGLGAIRHARDFAAAPDQPIRGWMTPRYVIHSWALPRDTMIQVLQLERAGGRETLKSIADRQGVPVETLIQAIEAAIAAHRADNP